MRYKVTGRAKMQEACWHCDGQGYTVSTHNIELEIEADSITSLSNAKTKGYDIAEAALQQYAEQSDLSDGEWDRPPKIEEIEDDEPSPAVVMRAAGVPDLFSLAGTQLGN